MLCIAPWDVDHGPTRLIHWGINWNALDAALAWSSVIVPPDERRRVGEQLRIAEHAALPILNRAR